jgi:hypothetical protein
MSDGAQWIWGVCLAVVLFVTQPLTHHVNPKLPISPPQHNHSVTDIRVVQALTKMQRRGFECSMKPRPTKVIFAYDSGQVAIISFSKVWKASHSGAGEVMAFCHRP